jgi:hypothetical protein
METHAPERPTAGDVWMRGLLMLILIIGFAVGQWLLNLTALVQFVWLLFARAPNDFIARFGTSLAIWLADVARFLTCATDEKPFPWRAWPGAAGNLPAP